jgi:hypothetical protein
MNHSRISDAAVGASPPTTRAPSLPCRPQFVGAEREEGGDRFVRSPSSFLSSEYNMVALVEA